MLVSLKERALTKLQLRVKRERERDGARQREVPAEQYNSTAGEYELTEKSGIYSRKAL